MLIRAADQRSLCTELERDLRGRHVPTLVIEPAAAWAPTPLDLPVLAFPASPRANVAARLWELAEQAAIAGSPAIAIIPGRTRVPRRLEGRLAGVVRVALEDAPLEAVVRDLLGTLIGPTPAWLGVWLDPVLMREPVSVAWWTGDLLAVDYHLGHLLRISAGSAKVLVPGLDGARDVHLDRRKLTIANTGAGEVILGTLRDDTVGDIQVIEAAAGHPLSHPNGVHQGEGAIAIADTDRHRILVSTDDPHEHGATRWHSLPVKDGMKFPCGVCTDERLIWTTDTFRHRILAHDILTRRRVFTYEAHGDEPGEFSYPIAVERWKDLLLVADEGNERVQALRVTHSETGLTLTPLVGNLGRPWIGGAQGLSVNGQGELAVADGRRGCVWTIALGPALAFAREALA